MYSRYRNVHPYQNVHLYQNVFITMLLNEEIHMIYYTSGGSGDCLAVITDVTNTESGKATIEPSVLQRESKSDERM